MLNLLLRILLYRPPDIIIDKNEEEQFEKLIKTIHDNEGQVLEYSLPFPKSHFLHYLLLKEKFVFHGSNNHNIETFEPREQTLYNDKLTKSVFATTDPIWPMFYAVFRRKSLIGSFRNGCLVHRNKRYHYYSLNESTIKNSPWMEGMLYILPKRTFSKSGKGKIQFDEWISHESVKPIGKFIVSVDDFLFHRKVATHKDGESLLRTWLNYKARTLWAKSKMASNSR